MSRYVTGNDRLEIAFGFDHTPMGYFIQVFNEKDECILDMDCLTNNRSDIINKFVELGIDKQFPQHFDKLCSDLPF